MEYPLGSRLLYLMLMVANTSSRCKTWCPGLSVVYVGVVDKVVSFLLEIKGEGLS